MTENTLLEFPCSFPIKVIGTNQPEFEQQMVMIVRQHVGKLGEGAVKSTPSRNKKYLAVTITFTATSKAQLNSLYQAIHAHPDVKMML